MRKRDDIPVATVYSTWTEDGGKVLSMRETPPMVWADPRRESGDVLRRYGYRLLEAAPPDRFGALYVRSWWRWALNWPPLAARSAFWSSASWLYRHPIIGVKKGTPSYVIIRARDLRPFPFGHRLQP